MSDHEDGVAARYRGGQGASEYWKFQEPIGRETALFDAWKISGRVSQQDRLLEFGCGGAFLLEALLCREKIGIEANPLPRAAGVARGLDVRASLDDVVDGWADVVWSHHALEHTLDPFRVLQGMRRVLVPGGQLVLWLPIDDWRAQRNMNSPDVNGHLWTWTPLLAHNLMKEAGFCGVEAKVVTHAWPRGARLLNRSSTAWRLGGAMAAVIRRDRQLLVTARS